MDALADAFGLTRALVSLETPTGSEGPATDLLDAALRRGGYRIVRQRVSPGRDNLLAFREPPALVFSTHLDCVPPYVPLSEDAEAIRGRGSCDAKGLAAGMVAAAERLGSGGERRIGLLFLVGEENGSDGARAAGELEPRGRYLVNGEPTENRLSIGQKGSLRVDLHASGRAAHSAYPEEGDSAIDRLLGALEKIRRADWGQSEVLGPATVNIGTLSGGVAANVIAPAAEAVVFVRVVTPVEEARRLLDSLLAGDRHLTYQVIAQNDPVFCETLPGFDCAPVAFGTDVPSLTAFGRPLLIGPGSITVAHSDHEKIEKAELLRAVEIYCAIGTELLRRSA